MVQIRSYTQFPEAVSGFELDPEKGWFSVLVPETTISTLNPNPSFELGTDGYTAVNSSLAQDATKQRRGIYSCKITPSSSALSGCYLALATTTGSQYSCSLDLYDDAGRWFDLYFADSSGNRVSRIGSLRGASYWKRVFVNFAEYAGGSRRIYITRRAGGNTQPFFIDGVMALPTQYKYAYFDGDRQSFLAGQNSFLWNGLPHASTSTMLANGNGGKEMSLLELGFRVLAVVGLGLMPFIATSTPMAGGGAQYQRSVYAERSFALVGSIVEESHSGLDRIRTGLINALHPQRITPVQPLVLRYHRVDANTGDETETLDIPAVYTGGLEGQRDNAHQERLELAFKQFFPAIYTDGEQGASLAFSNSVANANYILMRDTSGSWQALGSGMNADVNTLAIGPDGTLYAGGSFNLLDGMDRIAKWDGAAWSALGTGMGNDVACLAIGPDGTLYAGGSFTTAGGGAANYIAAWNGSAWSALGTGMNGAVSALAIGPDGTLYAGGYFTQAGGVTNTAYIAKWNGSAWSALGTGMDGRVTSLAIGLDGTLYAGGLFNTAGGVTVNSIAAWNGSAWSALGTGMDSSVLALAVGPDSILYAGGTFLHAGGVDANRTARWNGTAWSALGVGTNNQVDYLALDPNGILYVSGQFTQAGGLTIPDRMAAWNGSAWINADVQLPSATSVYCLLSSNNRLFAGYNASGSALAAGVTTVNNSGSSPTYPTVTLVGPGKVYQIKNITTGRDIYFNLTLLANETATLVLTPAQLSFVSSARGNLMGTILPGSNLDLFLNSGNNIISVYMTGTTAGSKATMRWQPTYLSTDAAAR